MKYRLIPWKGPGTSLGERLGLQPHHFVLRCARDTRPDNIPTIEPQETPMDDITKREPVQIRAEDINPRYNWGRALPALGIMGVDFEERVDYRRLHRYRIGRARQALESPSWAR